LPKLFIPEEFRVVDDLTRCDHFYVEPTDYCVYIWEWVAGAKFEENSVSQFIANFKKSPARRNEYDWRYKFHAINTAAKALEKLIPDQWLERSLFVPVPPSLVKGDPLHDDRLCQMLNELAKRRAIEWRELVYQEDSSTSKEKGITPQQRADNYRIDELQIPENEPSTIFVVDDMLTVGSHFKGMQIRFVSHKCDQHSSGNGRCAQQ
jgi:hypothetical protein